MGRDPLAVVTDVVVVGVVSSVVVDVVGVVISVVVDVVVGGISQKPPVNPVESHRQ